MCAGLCLPAATVLAQGDSGYVPQGGEYLAAGTLPKDQVYPDLAVRVSGGIIVWQDNITDSSSQGISAQQLDGNYSPLLSPFRVNVQGTNEQARPRVSLLKGGGAVFVWQSGIPGFQHIQARFLSSSNTWLTSDIMVNALTNYFQTSPCVTTLTNGDVVVAWASYNQESAGSMQGVYAQRFSSTGTKLGGEFLVNQATAFNQRTPAIAPLSDGKFAIAWVSEQQRFENSVDIFARFFNANGTAASVELLVSSTSTNVCANPSLAASSDGGFLAAWSSKSPTDLSNSWDIAAVPVAGGGFLGIQRRLNTQTYGDQFGPRVSAAGADYLAVWTSMAQDGSAEGVFGQFLRADGSLAGGEFRVNSVTASQQLHPVVASDQFSRFVAAWTSFGGGVGSFDLRTQRFASTNQPLSPLAAPFVSILSSNRLSVTWPKLVGFNVANYEVYADGAATATAVTTNNLWVATGLAPSSTHFYRVGYVLVDERRSPLSEATTNTTYAALWYYDLIPSEWMSQYFGPYYWAWPQPWLDSDGDGASNQEEFLAGTNPNNAASVLRMRLQATGQGLFLNWNTQPGLMYQVQTSTDMKTWSNLGGLRLAQDSVDSMYVGGTSAGYYRVLRLR